MRQVRAERKKISELQGAQHREVKRVTIQRASKGPNHVTSTFFNAVHLVPKDLRFEYGVAAPNLFLASAAI